MKKVKFDIQGMTCSSCSSHVEKAVNKLKGIQNVNVNLFHGNENAVTFGFTQFLLLLPIIYVNRNYFIVGFKRLWKRTPNMDSLIAIGSTAATIYGIFAIYMIGYGLGHNQIELLKIAGSLEKNSEHPLAEAIIEKVKEEQIELYDIKEFTAVSGRGVKGKIDGKSYFGGNISFMKENNIDISEISSQSDELLKQGKTVLYFANESSVIGMIAVADTIKDTSYQGIQELKKKGIEDVMIKCFKIKKV